VKGFSDFSDLCGGLSSEFLFAWMFLV